MYNHIRFKPHKLYYIYEMSSITINMSFLKNYLHINLHENHLNTSMTFQNITMAKPSHLYLAAKPYLDPAAASINPYLAS